MKRERRHRRFGLLPLAAAAAAAISLLLCGCGSEGKSVNGASAAAGGPEEETTYESESEPDQIGIGLSVDSFIIERWVRDRDVFVAAAKDLGAEVNVQDAGGDVEEQISQIRYLIEKQMDVIVIVARDCDSLAGVIEEAHAAGVKVISYDRLIYHAGTDLYISFDNTQVGVLMAEALKEAIPDGGEIFMIQGSPDDNNIYMVKEGFDKTLEGSGLEVVYSAACEGWVAEAAADYVEEALAQYPDVKGIMCGNDDIASQVISVLAQHQLAGKVIVTGQDGDISACQRIVEGTQYMTAFKAVEDEAREAAVYAVKLAKGEKPDELTETVNDGTYEVPMCVLMPQMVNRENMDDVIIAGGYHSEEDVYLNVRNSMGK
ncbi:MAG: substrate-binding domain-containing protein [Lachnospiraceae bacterium]|nr:substrate-binding domain-containing protein [Lachnospiraceae bacterium]